MTVLVYRVLEVYCHTSPSGRKYVGFTSKGMQRRWKEHCSASSRGSSVPLHRAIRKHGPASFTHEVLERMSTESGAKRAEQLWIKELGSLGGGYNATAGGGGTAGWTPTPEAKARMAARKLGVPKSAQHRANMSAAMKLAHATRPGFNERRGPRAEENPDRLGFLEDQHRRALERSSVHTAASCRERAREFAAWAGVPVPAWARKRVSSPESRATTSAALRAAWVRRKARGS